MRTIYRAECFKCGWDCLILNKSAPYASTHPLLPLHPHRTTSLHRNHAQFKAYAQSHSYDSPLVSQPSMSSSSSSSQLRPTLDLLTPSLDFSDAEPVTHPWKDVYSERSTVERNWRRGRYPVRTLRRHTDEVTYLQFSQTLQHPSFPILIAGSCDHAVRAWNIETGLDVHCLRGHIRAVRTLYFDEAKLITGCMDHISRVRNCPPPCSEGRWWVSDQNLS
jgi:WD40 repeat protein